LTALHDTSIANPFSAIHGDKQQNERDWVLNEFKTGKSPIMVATDVASRGIGMIANPQHSPLLTSPTIIMRELPLCSA
jgi:ATP-dependent RNA helicase DDX5/DBP2